MLVFSGRNKRTATIHGSNTVHKGSHINLWNSQLQYKRGFRRYWGGGALLASDAADRKWRDQVCSSAHSSLALVNKEGTGAIRQVCQAWNSLPTFPRCTLGLSLSLVKVDQRRWPKYSTNMSEGSYQLPEHTSATAEGHYKSMTKEMSEGCILSHLSIPTAQSDVTTLLGKCEAPPDWGTIVHQVDHLTPSSSLYRAILYTESTHDIIIHPKYIIHCNKPIRFWSSYLHCRVVNEHTCCVT